ncbi:MAG: hypothetical protein ACT4TC_16845 [Myxococcaceae bacterium]
MNQNAVRSHYVAWSAMPGKLAVGTYLGNGVDNRSVSIGWQPEVVLVKGDAETGRYHPASVGYLADLSLSMSAIVPGTNEIQSLPPTSFTLGTDTRVNGSGTTYRWMALGKGGQKLAVTTTALNATVATCAGPLSVQLQDMSSAPANGAPTTINLATTSGGGTFYATAGCGGGAITATSIPTIGSSVDVYYRDTVAGSPQITASSPVAAWFTQIQTLNAIGPPAKEEPNLLLLTIHG